MTTKKTEPDSSQWRHSKSTWGKGHKLKSRKFHLNVGKRFITVSDQHLNRFPREGVESPYVEIYNHQLDMILGSLL